tara:strand:- start:1915 stop:3084 length:1170 start_codon:yes stop_codon:yes gene_type:complete
MRKKIAILGSTGSIGKTIINILNDNKNEFDVKLLSADKDYKTLLNQANKYNVKNLIITNNKSFHLLKKKVSNKNINLFNNFNSLNLIFKKKIDYVMSAITGINGLIPTLNIIKYTNKIAIANKESIICGWNLIYKKLKQNKTKFIPVDSEHFSIWYGTHNLKKKKIEKIFITASGGPFYNFSENQIKNATISQALKHPNWKMGKKISIDSATLINKIYEVIEAKNIFNIDYNKIDILIHPKSYVHAIIKFNDGLIKLIAHETTMDVPVFNTLFFNTDKNIKTNKLNIDLLNNLNLKTVSQKKFPMVKLIKMLPKKSSLFETVIVSANDMLVELFLNKKIKFIDIQKKLFDVLKSKEFLKYKKIYPKSPKQIIDLNNYVRIKILKKVYKK